MIELVKVSRYYGKVLAVNQVSFALPACGVVGLLGQNGAGKTTLMNMITGYLPPSQGKILVNGLDLQANPRECKRKIGYLPEKPPLYPEMSVTEYLAFVCQLREVVRGEIPKHIERILSLCDLTERRNQLLGSLSKGFQQRVGLAQALCGNPPLLVLDEPTVGLDPLQAVEIRALLQELGKDHLVLFSTHLLSEAQRICQRVLILNRGRLAGNMDLCGAEAPEQAFYLVVRSADDSLVQALRELPGIRKVKPVKHAPDGCICAELAFAREAGEAGRLHLFQLLSARNAPILELVPHRDSLEDLFLRVIAEE